MDYSHKIVPPSYDVVFKAIFGKEESKPLIISLLSSILTIDINELEDLMIMNSELPMSHAAFSERVLYYWSKLFNNDLIRGEEYKDLKKCIVINFLDFILYEDPSMHAVFKIFEASRHLLFSEHLEIHMIELPKIEGYNKSIDNPLLFNWMAFLNVRSESDMAELKSKDDLPEEILIALEELEKLSLDPNMRMEALNKEMWIRDQIVLINMAKNAEIDGFAKGMAEGKAKGIAEGKVEGFIEGVRQEKYKIAKRLKALGHSIDSIIEATELTKEDVENL